MKLERLLHTNKHAFHIPIIYIWPINFSPRLQVLRSISFTQEGNTFLFCLSYLGVLFHANLIESLITFCQLPSNSLHAFTQTILHGLY